MFLSNGRNLLLVEMSGKEVYSILIVKAKLQYLQRSHTTNLHVKQAILPTAHWNEGTLCFSS